MALITQQFLALLNLLKPALLWTCIPKDVPWPRNSPCQTVYTLTPSSL